MSPPFMRVDDAAPGDHVATDGDLPIIVPVGDIETLRGATLRVSTNSLEPGLTMDTELAEPDESTAQGWLRTSPEPSPNRS